MSRRNFLNIGEVGNFTKKAVENFEENIVNRKNYLEKVKLKMELIRIWWSPKNSKTKIIED